MSYDSNTFLPFPNKDVPTKRVNVSRSFVDFVLQKLFPCININPALLQEGKGDGVERGR